MQKNELKHQLISYCDITEDFAEKLCVMLSQCNEVRYKDAIIDYVHSEKKTTLYNHGYSTDILMDNYGMDYLNAILILLWIETSPEVALDALDSGIDYII